MSERVCCYCGELTRRHYHARYCWACFYARQPFVVTAVRAVLKAARCGQLQSVLGKLCADCLAPASAYDHRDYSRPLAIDPVCRSCNIRRGPAKFPSGTRRQSDPHPEAG